jgi:hypothetical protein
MNSSFVSGSHLYLAVRGLGKVLVDVQALEDSILNGEAGSSLYGLNGDFARSADNCCAILLPMDDAC